MATTKSEARSLGTERGAKFAETFSREQLIGNLDAQRENILAAAVDESARIGNFKVGSANDATFVGAFQSAARQGFIGRRNELPEVQAERRARHLNDLIDGMARSAADAIAKFQANLNENACYAFEWADSAMEAAARQTVAASLKAIIAHPEGGIEKAIEEVREQALRGARYPSRSTSAVTNFMAQAKTAAYAEIAERMAF